jgi:hypothetical protein
MSGFELDWLYRKPFDPRPGNEQFFLQMYAVMNLLRAMEVPAGGRILEIGSGPGWVTELLMLLGYEAENDAQGNCRGAGDHVHLRSASRDVLQRGLPHPNERFGRLPRG